MPEDTIASALGVRPMLPVPKVIEPTEVIQLDEKQVGMNQVDTDLETARAATKEALDQGLKALEGVIAVAESSEHPRAYEVVANMVNTVTHAAEQLIKLQKMRREISTPEDEQPERGPVNVVVMSTAEMLRQIRSEMKQ